MYCGCCNGGYVGWGCVMRVVNGDMMVLVVIVVELNIMGEYSSTINGDMVCMCCWFYGNRYDGEDVMVV